MNTQAIIETDDVDIARVFENTFLGLIMDKKITWKPRIRHV